RCGKGWKGNRCHISAKPLQPPTSTFLQNGECVKRKKYLSIHSLSGLFYLFCLSSNFADIWIGFGIGFLMIKITAAALYFLSKKKVPDTKVPETENISFANPLYKDFSSSEKVKSPGYATSPAVQISVSPWHEYLFNEDVNATSFPNPLYGTPSEDMEKLCSSLK
ncbi:MALR1 protein, partial [Onychorhynchus coronatus]|nr:MALR1 protein [Onychorhynchus coronatus]